MAATLQLEINGLRAAVSDLRALAYLDTVVLAGHLQPEAGDERQPVF